MFKSQEVAEIISERSNVELGAYIALTLTDEFKDVYDKSVEMWQKLIRNPDWWKRPTEGGELFFYPLRFPLLVPC